MQIHELDDFIGTISDDTLLAIDDGTETTKVPATALNPNPTYYGTSDTEAATSTKIVACTGFILKTGVMIAIKFANNNSENTAYLNVNGTGAKRIRKSAGSTQSVSNLWEDGDIVTFVYDGSSWIIPGPETDLIYEDITSLLTITKSSGVGVCNIQFARRYGNLLSLNVQITCPSNVSAGGDVFVGSLSLSGYNVAPTSGAAFYGSDFIIVTNNSAGNFVARAPQAITGTSNKYFSVFLSAPISKPQ